MSLKWLIRKSPVPSIWDTSRFRAGDVPSPARPNGLHLQGEDTGQHVPVPYFLASQPRAWLSSPPLSLSSLS